jgi:glycosyltransferase involved in cell wall biosynthesis
MRIAINGWFLLESGSGMALYMRQLLDALGRVDGMNEYRVMTPRPVKRPPELPSTFVWRVVPVGRMRRGGENVEKLFWEQATFPGAAKAESARLMHVPYFAPPLRTRGVRAVATIHDVIPLKRPEYRASPRVAAYMALVARAARQMTLILTVSQHAKRDIVEHLRVPEERVRVVPLAPAPQYRHILDAARLRDARERYGLGERFVMYVGGLDARKNVSTLIGAFAAVFHELGDPDLHLLVAGDPRRLGSSPLFPDWRPVASALGVAHRVVCRFIAEEDLPLVYSATQCFVYPSLDEGFGLPPLDAMACGAPVVCSDRTSLPEVVGTAGLLVNPEDPDALGTAIHRVLLSEDLRRDLRARGLARVRQFSWARVAVDTTAAYAEAAEAGG